LIAGDDLFVTQIQRLKKGISLGTANALIFKPKMVGTLSEALDVPLFADDHGYWVISSAWAG